jgi:hypothetical protein
LVKCVSVLKSLKSFFKKLLKKFLTLLYTRLLFVTVLNAVKSEHRKLRCVRWFYLTVIIALNSGNT